MNNAKQQLTDKIINIITFLQKLYHGIDNSIYESLNEDYIDKITVFISIIPNDWINGVLSTVTLCYDLFTKVIIIDNVHEIIKKHPRNRFWFEINTYNIFLKYCILNKIGNKHMEKSIKKICDEFIPLFRAVDKLLYSPDVILDRIVEMKSSDINNYDNILKDFLNNNI